MFAIRTLKDATHTTIRISSSSNPYSAITVQGGCLHSHTNYVFDHFQIENFNRSIAQSKPEAIVSILTNRRLVIVHDDTHMWVWLLLGSPNLGDTEERSIYVSFLYILLSME